MLLVLERQATDLQLALERRSADAAVSARDDFLAQVSHDVHGLLGAQKIYLALLTKEVGGELGRQIAPHLSALQKLGAEMETLISDLLDLAAVETGQLTLAPRPQSSAELLFMASAVFGPVARDRGQSLEIASAPADAAVMADATRALQVLGNLISNAIQFSPRDGKIRIGFEAAGDVVSFFVADSGPGVPAEHTARIFERCVGFGRESKGLGLGLFIARSLVEAHGGRLWLDTAVAPGALFRFTLPRLFERRRGHSA